MGTGKTGKIIGFLMLSIAAIDIWAQNLPGSIQLKILESSLVGNSYTKSIPLSFLLCNESEDNLLVYGLKKGGPSPAAFQLSEVCSTENVGTGMAFAIYKNDGKQIIPTSKMMDSFDQKPVTKEVLDSALQVMHTQFLKSKIELKSKEELLFTKEIPLNNYRLQKGKYYFQMVYYSGGSTAKRLKLNSTHETEAARLFQGCAVSDRIELIIN